MSATRNRAPAGSQGARGRGPCRARYGRSIPTRDLWTALVVASLSTLAFAMWMPQADRETRQMTDAIWQESDRQTATASLESTFASMAAVRDALADLAQRIEGHGSKDSAP